MNAIKSTLRRKGTSAEEAGLTLQQVVLMLALFSFLGLSLQAAQPAWWTAAGGPLNAHAANDYAAANQGQLKQFTEKAALYLNANLSGGAGSTLNGIVAGWSNAYVSNGYGAGNPDPADYKVVNQGQLKYVAHLVYDRLSAQGYFPTNYPAWTQTNASDYKAANLGELKQIFDFEVAVPQTPTNLVVFFSSTQATISWFDPVISVQTHTLQYSTNGGTTWFSLAAVSGTNRSYKATGLTLGANYSFRLTAGNAGGTSAQSTAGAAPVITLSSPTNAVLIP